MSNNYDEQPSDAFVTSLSPAPCARANTFQRARLRSGACACACTRGMPDRSENVLLNPSRHRKGMGFVSTQAERDLWQQVRKFASVCAVAFASKPAEVLQRSTLKWRADTHVIVFSHDGLLPDRLLNPGLPGERTKHRWSTAACFSSLRSLVTWQRCFQSQCPSS